MYSNRKLFVATILVGAMVIFQVAAEGEFGNGLFSCKEGKLVPGEAFATKLKACNDPDLYKDVDLKCVSVCTTEAIGGMKDGIPDKDLFTNILKTEFPEAAQEEALKQLDTCFENRRFDKEDKNCTSIAEFSACGTKLVLDAKC